jgi:ribosomal protein L11 methyltransferase
VIRLAVRVRRQDAELALAELLALAPAGVEERDLGDAVEYAVYGAPGELPELPDLRAAAGDALVEVTSSEVPDDWADRWRRFHVPVVVAGRLRIRPPWAAPDPSLPEVVVDPGRAFGTGAHATTRLCLELLLELEPGGVDHDPLSGEATAENAQANGVAVDVRRLDLRTEQLPAAATVTANLLRPLLLTLAARLPAPPPRALVASGLLRHEADGVAAAFAGSGLRETARREDGDWAALLLAR